ncbi:hypothetical protein PG996_008072 [Apiospora saccharicola]|uniref:Uncharacterized protein n=1 Tax=Apiospora saccharicola TaxID=335842 RepID=A0ABR1UWW0_9PEZI
MVGRSWSDEEERYFWRHIVPYSNNRVGRFVDTNEGVSWDELGGWMTAHFGNNARRNYGHSTPYEHWFLNMRVSRSPNAEPYLSQYFRRAGVPNPYSTGANPSPAGRRQAAAVVTAGSSGAPSAPVADPSGAGPTASPAVQGAAPSRADGEPPLPAAPAAPADPAADPALVPARAAVPAHARAPAMVPVLAPVPVPALVLAPLAPAPPVPAPPVPAPPLGQSRVAAPPRAVARTTGRVPLPPRPQPPPRQQRRRISGRPAIANQRRLEQLQALSVAFPGAPSSAAVPSAGLPSTSSAAGLPSTSASVVPAAATRAPASLWGAPHPPQEASPRQASSRWVEPPLARDFAPPEPQQLGRTRAQTQAQRRTDQVASSNPRGARDEQLPTLPRRTATHPRDARRTEYSFGSGAEGRRRRVVRPTATRTASQNLRDVNYYDSNESSTSDENDIPARVDDKDAERER